MNRSNLCLSGLLLFILLAPSSRSALAAQLSLPQYSRMAEQTAAALEKAARTGGKARARTALRGFPEQAEIAGAAGSAGMEVDNRALLKSLRRLVEQGSGGMQRAAQVLRNLSHSLGGRQESEIGAQGSAKARAALKEVLARREFKGTWIGAAMARLGRWLNGVLRRLFGWIPDLINEIPDGTLRIIRWGLLALIGLVAGWLLISMILRMSRLQEAQQQAVSGGAEPAKSSRYWLAQAEASLQRHEYREALRALHMAALMRLDETGVLPYQESSADGRFVRALRERGKGDLSLALARLNGLFAASWYGSASAGPEQYQAAHAHWEVLRAGAVS